MKKLERKWKRIIAWTFLVYLILLVAVLRFFWKHEYASMPWQDDAVASDPSSRVPHTSPSAPDQSVAEVNTEELSGLLQNASEEWRNASSEKQARALLSRVEELGTMEPERVEGVVNHLLEVTGTEVQPEKRVGLTELDLNSAVPVNMWQSVNDTGESGVWMELQDEQGQVAEMWVPSSEMSAEEEQALRAFEMMNQVPALHRLRPLLTPLMRK